MRRPGSAGGTSHWLKGESALESLRATRPDLSRANFWARSVPSSYSLPIPPRIEGEHPGHASSLANADPEHWQRASRSTTVATRFSCLGTRTTARKNSISPRYAEAVNLELFWRPESALDAAQVTLERSRSRNRYLVNCDALDCEKQCAYNLDTSGVSDIDLPASVTYDQRKLCSRCRRVRLSMTPHRSTLTKVFTGV